MERKPVILQTLLNALPAFLALAVPIFFLPLTTEFFEFNKLALVTMATILMLLMWVAKMFYDRKVEVAKSPVDFPLIALFVVTLLATIFSLHKESSIFGSQGRWFPSLFGMTVFLIFYYVVATNITSIKTIKTIINGLIIGITISSIVAVFSYFGISLGSASYLQVPNFTLTGSTVVATILAALAVSLSLIKIISAEAPPTKVISVAVLGINFMTVALMGSLPSWVVLVVGLLVAVYFTKATKWAENRVFVISAGMISVAFAALLLLPGSKDLLRNSSYPTEIRLSVRESWLVVSSVIRDFPILGTGPSTFGLNYTRYKPLSINDTNYWNVRFDKPFSEALALVGSIGIVGVGVALVFAIRAFRYSIQTKKHMTDNSTGAAVAIGFISILVVMFFTYATVTVAFLLMLFLALTTAKARLGSEGGVSMVRLSLSSFVKGANMSLASGEKEVFQYIVALPLVALAVVGGYLFYGQALGEYYMRSAILAAQENDGSRTYLLQQRAITANPRRSVYHNSYANTNLALANSIASREEITDDERTTIQALIAQAIRSARVTTEVVSPLSSANWETRANVYRALVGVADDAGDWAVNSYNTAIRLDPANPRLRLSLGGIYYASGDYLSAANLFNQATSLKGDFANAHYNLAQALKQLGNLPQAQRELEVVQRLVQPDSSDFERVAAEIEALSVDPTVAGATDKPTVEELEGAPVPEVVEQEPLVNVGEEEPIEGGADLDDTDVTPEGEVTPTE